MSRGLEYLFEGEDEALDDALEFEASLLPSFEKTQKTKMRREEDGAIKKKTPKRVSRSSKED